MGYTVVKELAIPRELMELPIKPDLFKAFDLDVTTQTPQEIMLARVELFGASYSGIWNVKALVSTGRSEEPVTVGEIDCAPGTVVDDVLDVTDTWIRESAGSKWVPGRPIRIPINDDNLASCFVTGVTLVRASV